MFQSNLKFFLKSTINIADTTSSTFIVSEDFELGAVIGTGGETVSLVLRNARQIERMEVTISSWVATIVKRGLTQVATATEDAGLKKQWTEGTTGYITALAFDLIDKGGDTMTGALKFSGTANQGLVVNSLTTTQRTALTPTNGAIVYDSTLGEMFQYIGGSWSAMASGSTQPNASVTVAGKVEIATSAQSIAGTDAGETGAILSVIPSDIAKNTQSGAFVYTASTTGTDTYTADITPALTAYTTGMKVRVKFTTANTGACSININSLGAKNIKTRGGNDPADGDISALSIRELTYDGTNFVITVNKATTAEQGIVEKATDAEVVTATDTERYMDVKQTTDLVLWIWFVASANLKLSADTSRNAVVSGTQAKIKEIQIGYNYSKGGTVRVKFDLIYVPGSWSGTARIYKNGSAVGTNRSTTTSWVTHSEDLTFAAGDLIQIYAQTTNDGTTSVRNFQLFFDEVKYAKLGTIITD